MMQEMQLPVEVSEDATRKLPSQVLKLASAPDTRTQRDIELIAQLKKEVAVLQVELAKSQNEVTRYEMLLRNARQREREIRAELASNTNKGLLNRFE